MAEFLLNCPIKKPDLWSNRGMFQMFELGGKNRWIEWSSMMLSELGVWVKWSDADVR